MASTHQPAASTGDSEQSRERPDTLEMVTIHRVFRRELRIMPELIRGCLDGDTRRSAVLAEHAGELLSGLHEHHTLEDELLWPLLLQRVEPPAELVHRMEAQHERVAEFVERANALLAAWRISASASEASALADTLDALGVALAEHLDEEERHILPLIEQHLTVAEWEALGERGRASLPPSKLLILLGAILEDAPPNERAAFLAKLPLPARIIYNVIGKRKYRRFVTALRTPA